jgi:hypothetical protein
MVSNPTILDEKIFLSKKAVTIGFGNAYECRNISICGFDYGGMTQGLSRKAAIIFFSSLAYYVGCNCILFVCEKLGEETATEMKGLK